MPEADPISRRACLARSFTAYTAFAAFAATPALGFARPRREAPPLVLAQEAPEDVDPEGFLVSEKLDGVRAFWDGSRLRFRSGLPVPAPAWFTRSLPAVALDGELWMGRGRFEATSGAVRRTEPDEAEWRALRYAAFELPGGAGAFGTRARELARIVSAQGFAQLQALEQAPVAGRAALQRRLDAVMAAGGEGLVLHRADAPYVTGRTPLVLKLKPLHDAEAVVLAHLPGQGRLEGRLGALRVRNSQGVVFDLGSGFSDAERVAPPPVGSSVSYRHRGHTGSGVPRFASYLRRHEPA